MAQSIQRVYRVPDTIPVNAKYPASSDQNSSLFWDTYIAGVNQCLDHIAMHGHMVSDMENMRDSMILWIENPSPIQDRDTLCEMCGIEQFFKVYRWTHLDLFKRILIVVSGCVASGCELPRGWNYWIVQQYLEDSLYSQGDKRRGTWREDGLFEHYMEAHQIYIPSIDELQ